MSQPPRHKPHDLPGSLLVVVSPHLLGLHDQPRGHPPPPRPSGGTIASGAVREALVVLANTWRFLERGDEWKVAFDCFFKCH